MLLKIKYGYIVYFIENRITYIRIAVVFSIKVKAVRLYKIIKIDKLMVTFDTLNTMYYFKYAT